MQSMLRFRAALRLGRNLTRVRQQAIRTQASVSGQGVRRLPVLFGTAIGLCAGGLLYEYNRRKCANITYAAAAVNHQNSVITLTKEHALYLWIHVKGSADAKTCAKVAANVQKYVDCIIPPKEADENDEVWAGVAFGPSFYAKVGGTIHENYTYPHRSGKNGDLPSTGGDIFIHAKSNSKGNLFQLAHTVLKNLPEGSVDKVEEIYGFVYRGGRDLSGFIDGTENPADDESREEVAVNKQSGGSYLITQRWVHNLDLINKTKAGTMENWVGRSIDDSTELRRKSITSHVARMTSGSQFGASKPFQIVRQSQPYGLSSKESGLFFIAYAASPNNFEYMLRRMTGEDKDLLPDDIMQFTTCLAGTYWYAPSLSELAKLK